MGACCAVKCKNRCSRGFKMHPFPKDPTRRKIWSQRLKRANWTPSSSSVLCQAHFTTDQYNSNGKRLKKEALPTIFAHTPHRKTSQRKPPKFRESRVECEARLRKVIFLDHIYSRKVKQLPQMREDLENTTNWPAFNHPDQSCSDVLPAPSLLCLDSISEQIEVHDIGWVEPIPHDIHLKLLKIRKLEVEIKEKQLETDALHRKLELASLEILNLQKKSHEPPPPTTTVDFLTADQIAFGERKSMRGYNWSSETIKRALQLRLSCGISGYETLLQQGYPLPSIRTLQRRTEHIQSDSGGPSEGLEVMKLKENTSPQKKDCVASQRTSLASSQGNSVSGESFGPIANENVMETEEAVFLTLVQPVTS
ncbi:uncharacterized protein LOC131888421 isoform X2 [Tigriopus californicus]|uniref:uncharacterized protein LOC131888421 isoform X2 n=1 Tax=Tigriopus californicus TaxID=6832 RepID=UPI0027DA4357|nr:uncharacterized protein LOC131888421 isoform X2 [Tigriopus californicus]